MELTGDLADTVVVQTGVDDARARTSPSAPRRQRAGAAPV